MNSFASTKSLTPSSNLQSSCSESECHYLLTVPGWVRLANLGLGLLCIILTSIGFEDDFLNDDGRFFSYTYFYGLGYKNERANVWSLIVIAVCFSISAVFLLLLVSTKGATTRWIAWNRFLNLSLAFLLLTGWISGLLGFLLFRQGCCRVEIFSTERISNDLDGYLQPCLCFINPHNDADLAYPVLLYQDAPVELKFVSAQPHHAGSQIASLVIMFINAMTYAVASILV